MMDSIATTSLLGHRPLCGASFYKDGSNGRRTVDFCGFPVKEFVGKGVICSSPKMCPWRSEKLGMNRYSFSPIKALAMELTKEAYSSREEDRNRILRNLNNSVETSTQQRPGLWPPPNKVDDPSLHNPLLRQERMGCGWLGAIFEWEGVIVEDNPDLEKQAWLALSQEEGKSPPPTFILRRIEGMKIEQAISEVLCWSRDPAQLRRMASRKEEIYQGLQGGIYRLRSGSREFVNVLMNYKIPMALVSTRSRGTIEVAIRTIEFEGFFNVIVTAEDVYRGKPDPEMFVYAAQLLKFTPERCIVFGNSNSTVEAAHDARMKCVAVASKHPMYELGAADLVVKCLNELSVVDLKNLADIDLPEFEPELEMEEEEDQSYPSTSVGVDDSFWNKTCSSKRGNRFVVAASPPTEDAVIATEPLTKQDLVNYLASGCKPKEQWRIGTEHEKFGFELDTLRPMKYEQIADLLYGLAERFDWEKIMEGDYIIGLKQGKQSVSLEPGGQFELSGAPLETLHQTCAEVNSHLYQVKAVAEEIGIGFLGIGFQPKWRIKDIPIMPKGRYDIMRNYMPKVGSLGLDMMFRTCTVQVNLDFSSESDMIRKFRAGLALQPIATALFANSPFTEGKPNGYLSMRSHIWSDTDNNRTGMLPFVFDDSFGFEQYVDYALDVPMYFVYRNKKYIDCTGLSFRVLINPYIPIYWFSIYVPKPHDSEYTGDLISVIMYLQDFLEGKLPAAPGELPTLNDWENHLTTIFPEVRLKRYLEMRGADGGPWRRLCALPAFWVGILYDEVSLQNVLDMTADWTSAERQMLRNKVPMTGLKTPFRDGLLRHVAEDVLKLAKDGLERRGYKETGFLNALTEVVTTGVTPAEKLLELYEGKWGRSVDPVFEELLY
ncbi:hypothetical protein IFM89_037711 [Coptis chinensis]|uniref:glutamate--cysteine ligase n=1 Tax=Coptis chinensis TaxID=261450 RepID=A0A835M2W1_9MAGN|nr:hypothetical protein IFM89_037711 [Coptis chinensis]